MIRNPDCSGCRQPIPIKASDYCIVIKDPTEQVHNRKALYYHMPKCCGVVKDRKTEVQDAIEAMQYPDKVKEERYVSWYLSWVVDNVYLADGMAGIKKQERQRGGLLLLWLKSGSTHTFRWCSMWKCRWISPLCWDQTLSCFVEVEWPGLKTCLGCGLHLNWRNMTTLRRITEGVHSLHTQHMYH